jgi:hypothetical protein
VENEDQSQEHILNWENLINGTNGFSQTPAFVIISQPYDEAPITPTKQSVSPPEQHPKTSSPRQKTHYRSRQISASSDTDSAVEYGTNRLKRKPHSTSQQQLSVDEDHNELKQNPSAFDSYRPYTTASDILLRRLANQQTDRTSPNKKKSSTPRHEDNVQSPTAVKLKKLKFFIYLFFFRMIG